MFTQFRKKLTFKVLAILGISLAVGLLSLCIIAIWLQTNSTMNLQMKNTRTIASIMIKDRASCKKISE